MRRLNIKGKGSNWETIAFVLIRRICSPQKPYFTRTQIISIDNLPLAITFSNMLGHKERPEQPAATLDRTIQNLRNKGYIEFIARGEYKLTEKGFNTMNTEHENIIEPLIKQLSQKNHNEADRRVQL